MNNIVQSQGIDNNSPPCYRMNPQHTGQSPYNSEDGIGNNADTDDDGDGVLDEDDYDSLNPDVTKAPNEINWYLWIGLIIIIMAILGGLLLLRKKSPKIQNQEEPDKSEGLTEGSSDDIIG
ncbi:MAG: LPXTG cell wall anchor domain-containing protein [Candidatus Peribacteraceae bacterium]|nr:LPXTG cell wall anchor domain-containing protein [Candidatus Peribacteraceae bacterium]